MKRITSRVVAGAIAMTLLFVPDRAKANDGAVAAGVAGGLVGGLLLGSAMAPRPYYQPAPIYVAPPPYHCYWTPGAPVWDDWRGVWVHPRVRVCD